MKRKVSKLMSLMGLALVTLGMSHSALAATYVRPIDNGTITTGFNGYPGHGGVDYAVPTGTPIRAVADGKVKFAGPGAQHSWMTWLAGNSVLIQHNDGMHSGYAHLSSIATSTGASVKQGDIIGYVGSTGMATGPHLHFEFLPASPNFKNGYSGRIDPTGMIASAPNFSGQTAAQSAPVTPVNQTTSTAPSTSAKKQKIYRVDQLQKVNGVWLVKNNALVPTDFAWADNGIPASEIDEVDANGNPTSDQVLQTGGYFVFNPKTVSRVDSPLQGTAGYRWAKTTFANGRTGWFVVDGRDQLIYGQ